MGVVHRALDRDTGEAVAVKVMREDVETERFAQEASVLASLRHPAIVRYLAHGRTPDEQPFIAMEWVDGESLDERLARGRLSVAETLALGLRLSEALTAAHDRHVVHRDLKPSNVALPGGDPRLAKLLDFGIARRIGVRPITRTGLIVGSAGYMAPEQASGERGADERADLFSLGCILFECLTGQAAFSGEHGIAVLAKVLREPAPRVRDLAPDVDAALDALVVSLLEKQKERRPGSAREVRSALSELARRCASDGSPPTEARRPAASKPLRDSEQRLVSALLLELGRPEPLADTVTAENIEQQVQRAFAIARSFGGEPALLGGSVMLSTHTTSGPAAHVTSATACALELRAAFPAYAIVVATGRATDSGLAGLGPVLDRAAGLLQTARAGGEIELDEVTARLAESRFDLVADAGRHTLKGRRNRLDGPRLVLGKPTPLVGRRKELALLSATLEECVQESVPRVVVVLGEAGAGKSRLREELLRFAHSTIPTRVLFASGDPVAAGGTPQVAADLVRFAAGLSTSAGASDARARLDAHLGRLLCGEDLARAREFLGELIQVDQAEEPSLPLRTARNDPHLMADWLERTFASWIRAECEGEPVLIILDDLHWADAATVRYVDAALRLADDLPLMVLALGRPETETLFGDLWRRAAPARIRLERISPKAGAQLVHAVLGNEVPKSTVERLVDRSDGNPFYLEELIRRHARDSSADFPESVLAVVQARLERLEPDARRLLRGASVFGERFVLAGLVHVVGRPPAEVADWLSTLVDRELIVERGSSAGEARQYAFTHALIHDAAYAMLTDEDRRQGHALAAEWLEKARSPDPLVLTVHYERAEDSARALGWLVQAARRVTSMGNLPAGDRLVERALSLGVRGETRGVLLALRGQILGYRGDMRAGRDLSVEAFGLLPPGTDDWFMAAGVTVVTETFLGVMERTPEIVVTLSDPQLPLRATAPCGYAMGLVFAGLMLGGQTAMARALLARLEQVDVREQQPDAIFSAWLHLCRCWEQMWGGHDLGRAWHFMLESIACFDLAGESVGKIQALYTRCELLTQFGRYDEAEAVAEQARQLSLQVGSQYFADMAGFARGQWRAMVASPDEIEAVALPVLELKTSMISTAARAQLAEAAHRRGTFGRARELAMDALERCVLPDVNVAMARGVLARVAFDQGNPAEALGHAERGLALEASWFRDHTALRLLRAEALRALGRETEADAVLAEARRRLLTVAERLPVEFRESFLKDVPDNARTLA